MAVILNMTYSKKLGLPNYSSHSCAVSIQTEIADLDQTANECNRLYALLQTSVDQEIQEVGFLPDATRYGMIENKKANGANGNHQTANGNGVSANDAWQCSEKQEDLICKIIEEHGLAHREIENLAQQRFGCELKALNKLQARGLISELLERYPAKQNANGVSANRRTGSYVRKGAVR